MSVPIENLIAMCFTLLVSGMLPFVLWFLCAKKTSGSLRMVLYGSVSFFIAELLLRIPAIQILAMTGITTNLEKTPVLYAFVFAASAALVQTLARQLAVKCAMDSKYSYYGTTAVGIGFAGMESLALVTFNYISYMTVGLLVNSGFSENVRDLAQTLEVLAQPHWTEFFFTGLERIFVIVIQIALTVLVGWFLTRRRGKIGYWIPAAIQFGYLFVAQLLSSTMATWGTELFLFLCAAAAGYLMYRLRPQFPLQAIPKNPNFRS